MKYSRDHFWIRLEDEVAVIGLTDTGITEWGMILYIDLPEMDMRVDQGEYLGSVENVDGEHDLRSPLSGRVTAVNRLIERAALLLHESPYDKGWLYAIQWSRESELEQLLDAEAYKLHTSLE
nr:glycine cleavage system protein H [Paenibacillus sp. SYP-B3998]